MKNNILIFFALIFFSSTLHAEDLLIESKKIKLEKKGELSIFEEDVIITTAENNIIKSDYAEYDKKNGTIILKKNIRALDSKKNEITSNNAIYKENTKILESIGPTEIITVENYVIKGSDIVFDDLNKLITSNSKTTITDPDNNIIYLDSFQYLISDYVFKSVGEVRVEDTFENVYNFSQVYIDTKKKELLGTDIKTFINKDEFKSDSRNKPRIFANTVSINKNKTIFDKSNFTI